MRTTERYTHGQLTAIRRLAGFYDVALSIDPTTLVGQIAEVDGMFTAHNFTNAHADHVYLNDAMADLERRWLTARRLARAVRAIRPAPCVSRLDTTARTWDDAYNAALRDVEAVLRDLVGSAADTEGYTAITGDPGGR